MPYLPIWNRRLLVTLFQGFASGLPLALTAATLQAWFAVSNISVAAIGALTLVGQPYAYKFLWAPFLDRYLPPFLGRRRGWILLMQLALVVTFLLTLLFNPITTPLYLAVLALIIAFLSASQDIAIDAYRTEILSTEERGLGAALYAFGYRVAMLTSGGGALILADHFGWHTMYLIMASLMLLEVGVTLFAPPEIEATPPVSMHQAIVEPLRDFFTRDKAILILAFVILYKLTDAMALSLGSKFLIDLGFSLTQIGAIYKGVGFAATILGTFVGGYIMLRISIYQALLWFGICQAFSNLLFAWLALAGKNLSVLMIAVAGENFCGGLATIALLAFLMGLCNKRYTATQYALLSSVAVIGRVYIGPFAGFLAKHYAVSLHPANWSIFYVWSFILAIPSFILLYWLQKKH